jgi:hypothetical protein
MARRRSVGCGAVEIAHRAAGAREVVVIAPAIEGHCQSHMAREKLNVGAVPPPSSEDSR